MSEGIWDSVAVAFTVFLLSLGFLGMIYAASELGYTIPHYFSVAGIISVVISGVVACVLTVTALIFSRKS